MTTAYPLAWPSQRPRTPASGRRDGSFGKVDASKSYRTYKSLSIADAVRRLQDELDRLGARLPVLSSNVETRLDGLPRSDRPDPADPGVAVYFELRGKPHCLPCDTFNRVADNIAAIAAHIEKTRAIERYGVASVADMFTGFQALPAPGTIPWWSVLQVRQTATKTEIEAAFRKLATERHPDRGGSDAMMADLNTARDAALRERG